MDQREQLLLRVREGAERLSQLAQHGLNVPVGQYLDTVSLNALCISFGLDPSDWRADDLERILIIRDGLYNLRNRLRDEGDEGEHSVEQLLSGLDRLYADLERALRALGADQLSEAQRHLARGREGPQIPTVQAATAVDVLKKEATELLTQTYVSHRRIEVNFIKIEKLNIELFKNAKLIIERLSASVFAIKLSLEQSVVLQGTFKLLTEGADRVLASLRDLVAQIGKAYGATKDFLTEWSSLAEKGGRFTKMVGQFLKAIFGEEPLPDRQIEMRLQTAHQGPALLCGYPTGAGMILLGGRDGLATLFDTASARVTDQRRISEDTINAACSFGEMTAFGTDGGLGMAATVGRRQSTVTAPYRERVMAVVYPGWGAKGSEGALVTGSREGSLRRWTMASRFSEQAHIQMKRSINRILVVDDNLIVASGSELLFVDEELDIKRRVRMEQPINDVVVVDEHTLAVCGLGTIATVNLAQGVFTRLVISSSDEKYTCLFPLGEHCICVGTETGKIIAIDLNSAAEIGAIDTGFTVRGVIGAGPHRFVAFGGSWNGKGKNLAVITWKSQELAMDRT
ncbi:hypothetical protein IQ16_07604 [Bradyrhizobium huanghuaihaiense]|uniref:WD40 repeat protein n=1 Tax=Bradyrhizobium huanghuaihaiense TaxID=990078 RepID=A0A562QVZ7_9BRAD|nr:hypothetical protein [Bradyrhizobium huanghuaihaiense]TWI60484.1 hypothetical protein IQ16_07604 [Bradyrhizobium huanghuaihaiense]